METYTQGQTVPGLAYYKDRGWEGRKLSNVRLDGWVFPLGPHNDCLRLIGGENVELSNCTFEGNPGVLLGSGLTTARVDRLAIRGCEFSGLRRGTSITWGKALTVEGSKFHNMSYDGLMFGGVMGAHIHGNRFWDWTPAPESHPDAIQALRPTADLPMCEDAIIEDNFCEGQFQSIFLPQTVRSIVRGNVCIGPYWNGIGLADSFSPIIENNLVMTLAGGFTQSRINIARAIDVTFRGYNRAVAFERWPDTDYPPT